MYSNCSLSDLYKLQCNNNKVILVTSSKGKKINKTIQNNRSDCVMHYDVMHYDKFYSMREGTIYPVETRST